MKKGAKVLLGFLILSTILIFSSSGAEALLCPDPINLGEWAGCVAWDEIPYPQNTVIVAARTCDVPNPNSYDCHRCLPGYIYNSQTGDCFDQDEPSLICDDPNEDPIYAGCSSYYYNYSEPIGGVCYPENPNDPLNVCITNTDESSCDADPDACFWDLNYQHYFCSAFNNDQTQCSTTEGCVINEICDCPSGFSVRENGTIGTVRECTGVYSLNYASCDYVQPETIKHAPVCWGQPEDECISIEKCVWRTGIYNVQCWVEPNWDEINGWVCPQSDSCTIDTQITNFTSCILDVCEDSDGGFNIYERGNLTLNGVLGVGDYCKEGDELHEWFCNLDGSSNKDTFDCPNGCVDGACSDAPPGEVCSDTDGGKVYDVQGNVTLSSNPNVLYPDFCTSSTDLTEYYCFSDTVYIDYFSCSYQCFNGACISAPPTVTELYFGDLNGVELVDYTSKNIDDTVYLWANNVPDMQEMYIAKLMEDDSGEFLGGGDDLIIDNLIFTSNGSGSYYKEWSISQASIDICKSGELFESFDGNCEFYFEVESQFAITYESPRLIVPITPPISEELDLYWADPGFLDVKIAIKHYDNIPIPIAAVALNYPTGYDQFFIYEKDPSLLDPDDEIGIYPGTSIDIDGGGENNDMYYIMTIDRALLDRVSSDDGDLNYEFYFDLYIGEVDTFLGEESDVLNVDEDQGICGDGICQSPPENSTSCPEDCSAYCTGIAACWDYDAENHCNYDTCDVAGETPPEAVFPQVDACQWDAADAGGPRCNKVVYITTGNGFNIGSCTSEENPRTDTCDDGFLSYSWNSTWNWGLNSFDNIGDCASADPECSNSGACIEDPVGTYHCDPYGSYEDCDDGFATIACPAQVQLDFFDWRNVIAAVVLIVVLYVLFKKTKKPRKSSVKKKVSVKKK